MSFQIPMFYRLNPHLNPRPRATSMFDVAKALDVRLITGQHWGDDYLIAPEAPDHRELVEGLLKEEGIYFEPVEKLPFHLQFHLQGLL